MIYSNLQLPAFDGSDCTTVKEAADALAIITIVIAGIIAIGSVFPPAGNIKNLPPAMVIFALVTAISPFLAYFLAFAVPLCMLTGLAIIAWALVTGSTLSFANENENGDPKYKNSYHCFNPPIRKQQKHISTSP